MKLLDDLTENQTHLLATFIGTTLLVLYALLAIPENTDFPIVLAIILSAIAAPLLGYAIIFSVIIIEGIYITIKDIYEFFKKEDNKL